MYLYKDIKYTHIHICTPLSLPLYTRTRTHAHTYPKNSFRVPFDLHLQEQRLHVALRSEAALCQALRAHLDLEEAARCRAQEALGSAGNLPETTGFPWWNREATGKSVKIHEIYGNICGKQRENGSVQSRRDEGEDGDRVQPSKMMIYPIFDQENGGISGDNGDILE